MSTLGSVFSTEGGYDSTPKQRSSKSTSGCSYLEPAHLPLTGLFNRITCLFWCFPVQNPLRLVSPAGYGNSLGSILRTANVLLLKKV